MAYTFSAENTREIADVVRYHRSAFRGQRTRDGDENNDVLQVRMAKVVDVGSPDAGNNVVKVELGLGKFDDERLGRVTLDFTRNEPQSIRYAMEMTGPPPRVDDKVLMALHNRRWWIIKNTSTDLLKAVTVSGITPNSSGTVRVWKGGVASNRYETAWLNWMHGNKPVSGTKQCVIKWFDDEQKWVIILAECEA